MQHLSGKPRGEVTHLLHARCMGSYLRGKLDCGDADLIIAPGPACGWVGMGPLLAGLLERLAARGCITQVGLGVVCLQCLSDSAGPWEASDVYSWRR
jgi:hypothetical protein